MHIKVLLKALLYAVICQISPQLGLHNYRYTSVHWHFYNVSEQPIFYKNNFFGIRIGTIGNGCWLVASVEGTRVLNKTWWRCSSGALRHGCSGRGVCGGHVPHTSCISALCPPHFLQTLSSSVSPGSAPIRNGLRGEGSARSQKARPRAVVLLPQRHCGES